jgi:hypothetical protein
VNKRIAGGNTKKNGYQRAPPYCADSRQPLKISVLADRTAFDTITPNCFQGSRGDKNFLEISMGISPCFSKKKRLLQRPFRNYINPCSAEFRDRK